MRRGCRRSGACRRPLQLQLLAGGPIRCSCPQEALPNAMRMLEVWCLQEALATAAACGGPSNAAVCKRPYRMRSERWRLCSCKMPQRMELPVGGLLQRSCLQEAFATAAACRRHSSMPLPAEGLAECRLDDGGLVPAGGLCECSCLPEAFSNAAACRRFSQCSTGFRNLVPVGGLCKCGCLPGMLSNAAACGRPC